MDGDGCADLVVGSPHAERNRAVIYWGARGARPTFAQVDATALAVAAGAGANVGWSVAAAEGVVAVGAPGEDVAGVRRAGAVHVFTVGPGRKVTERLRITQETPGVPGVAEPGDMFGWSLALGRLGGDPDALDLVIGAPYEDIEAGAGRDAGAITIVYDVTARRGGGRLRGVSRHLAAADDGLTDRAGDRFGYALAYGEWGGLAHLAVSAPGADVAGAADAGAVRLYEAGGKAGPRAVRLLRQGAGGLPDAPEEGDEFGHALGFAGGNVLVGAPFEDVRGVPEAGAVTVVPLDGGPGSFVTEGRVRLQAYDHFGWSVTGVGEEWMAVGVPDEQATHGGAVALIRLLGDGVHRDVHLLAPVQGHPPPPARRWAAPPARDRRIRGLRRRRGRVTGDRRRGPPGGGRLRPGCLVAYAASRHPPLREGRPASRARGLLVGRAAPAPATCPGRSATGCAAPSPAPRRRGRPARARARPLPALTAGDGPLGETDGNPRPEGQF